MEMLRSEVYLLSLLIGRLNIMERAGCARRKENRERDRDKMRGRARRA